MRLFRGVQNRGETWSRVKLRTIVKRSSWKTSGNTSQLTFTCSKSAIEALSKGCKLYSKLTIKTPERRHWRRSGVFIVNFNHISHPFFSVSIVNFEQVNVSWFSLNYYFLFRNIDVLISISMQSKLCGILLRKGI